MRFACLGSGSRGNAWLVEGGATRLMLDCGFGLRETEHRLCRLGVEADAVDAIVLTHEHADHIRGAVSFARRHGCSVWLTHGCLAMMEAMGEFFAKPEVVDSHTMFIIGELALTPFPVPHDAREPVQYVVSDGQTRFGLLTDTGHVTPHMVEHLSGCHGLALECNHDVTLLRQGSYPAPLKRRISGPYGHLDNMAAASLLQRLNHGGLQQVVAAHLSEENNQPGLARQALSAALGCSPEWIGVAGQELGLDWRDIR